MARKADIINFNGLFSYTGKQHFRERMIILIPLVNLVRILRSLSTSYLS